MSHGKQNSEKLINPLAKARGLGSAHHGANQWLMERISAAILLPLMLWLVCAVVHMDHDYASFVTWLGQPFNAVLMILTILPLFYHTAYGLQVVIEDYIHCHAAKFSLLVFIKGLALFLAIACIFSILKVSLGG